MISKLSVLGLLNQEEMHGYEIIKRTNTEMTNFCNIKIGSIYFALNDLAKKGFIESRGTIKGKREPDRTVYGITKKGQEEYLVLLRKALLRTYAGRYPVDIALHFKDDLQRTDYKRILADKMAISEKVLRTLEDLQRDEKRGTTKMILRHQILHQKAELSWLKELLFEDK